MSGMTPEQVDWVDDESLTFDEAAARFESLGPQPTVPPRSLPGQGTFTGVVATVGVVETTHVTPGMGGRVSRSLIAS